MTSTGQRAGASAAQEFEAQRKAWIKRNRRTFRLLDTLCLLVVAAGFAIGRAWPSIGGFDGGLLAGMAVCFVLSVRMNPPGWIMNWQAGAVGEQRTGKELTRLGPEWTVVHDVARADGANVDHIVIGPPGVFVLDTKNIGTGVRVEGDVLVKLRPDGTVRGRSRYAGSARWQARELSRLLAAGGAACWVNAVIVVWGDMTPAHMFASNVHWVAGEHVTEWLLALPPTARPAQVTRAADALSGGQLTRS